MSGNINNSKGPPQDMDVQMRKVFVGGLPHNLALEEFRTYFEQYGSLDDCVILQDKRTQKPRGFGFVTYTQVNALDKVIEDYNTHSIHGKWVECKRAVPISLMKDGTVEPGQQMPNKVPSAPGDSKKAKKGGGPRQNQP